MKKIFLCFFILNLTLFSQTISDRYVKENVAVYPFEDETSKDLSSKLTILVENSLTRLNRFNLVDRRNLDKYLKELELQLAGITDKEVIEVGKIYGYNKAITGTITYADTTFDYDNYDGTGTIYGKVDLVLHIVDVSTTKILYSSKITGLSYYSVNRYPNKTLRDAALSAALEDLAKKVSMKMRDIFKIEIKISSINDGNIVLLAGFDHGISKNTRFKVYSKGSDITLDNGVVIKGGYKDKGSLKVKEIGNEYTLASVSRGKNISVGDIAREFYVGNFVLGLNLYYSSYNLKETKQTYKSSVSTGTFNVDVSKNDFSFGIHFKTGYNIGMFTPNFSFGILFGDFFKSSYGFENRFNVDINFDIYQEIVQATIIPYIAIAFTQTQVGYISGGDYYFDNNYYISNGSKIYSTDLLLGIGILADIKYNITDVFGVDFAIGYRLYTDNINIEYSHNGNSLQLKDSIKFLNLTGFEFSLGVYRVI